MAWVSMLHVGALFPSVCGDGWFNTHTLIIQQVYSLTQPQSEIRLGQVRLLKPAIIHTHQNSGVNIF